MSWSISLCVLLVVSRVSGFTLKFFIHFFLIQWAVGIYSHPSVCGYPIFPALFIDGTAFSPVCVIKIFIKNHLTVDMWIDIWALYSAVVVSVSIFMPISCYFDHYSFILYFEIRQHYIPSFVLFLQDSFGDLRSFVVPHEFYNFFSVNVIGILIGLH